MEVVNDVCHQHHSGAGHTDANADFGVGRQHDLSAPELYLGLVLHEAFGGDPSRLTVRWVVPDYILRCTKRRRQLGIGSGEEAYDMDLFECASAHLNNLIPESDRGVRGRCGGRCGARCGARCGGRHLAAEDAGPRVIFDYNNNNIIPGLF